MSSDVVAGGGQKLMPDSLLLPLSGRACSFGVFGETRLTRLEKLSMKRVITVIQRENQKWLIAKEVVSAHQMYRRGVLL
jgi:hypothetical protein